MELESHHTQLIGSKMDIFEILCVIMDNNNENIKFLDMYWSSLICFF